MLSAMKLSGFLSIFVALVSAQNNKTTCLKYLEKCTEGSSRCCNHPMISCLPDKNNGTSCLSIYDLVNLNPELTGLAAFQPLLPNLTGFIAESIDVNGKNVYNTTETFPPKAKENTNPNSTSKPNTTLRTNQTPTTKPKDRHTVAHKAEEREGKEGSSTHKPHLKGN